MKQSYCVIQHTNLNPKLHRNSDASKDNFKFNPKYFTIFYS